MTVEETLRDPSTLAGRMPHDIENALGAVHGWRVERLGPGGHFGQGWVLREYGANGSPTGRLIRWHPGGGHHGPESYWRVASPELGRSGIVR